MHKIVLCCQHGASTDLLANKMMEAAEKLGLDVAVEAYPYTSLEKVIDQAAVVLIAPQIRFKEKTFKAKYADKGVPFLLVEPSDYGLLRGEKVLKQCLAAIGEEV